MTEGISIGAILVAAIVNTVIGGLWWSPMAFGKAWSRAVGMSQEDMHKGNGATSMIWQFIVTLVMSFVMAAFIDAMGARTIIEGIQTGFMVWLGFIVTINISQQIFEKRPKQLFWINSGYYLVALAVMGAILAAWY